MVSSISAPSSVYKTGGTSFQGSSGSQEDSSGGSIFGSVGTTLLTAAVVGGSLLAARKFLPALKNVDAAKILADDAKPMEKVKSKLAKSADWLEEHTIGLFKKKGAEDGTIGKSSENPETAKV